MFEFMEVVRLLVSNIMVFHQNIPFLRIFLSGCYIHFLEGGSGIYFNAFEIKKLDEKNQADHVTAHLIEVVVAHLRKKHGADVANGPSAAMNAQQVLIYHIHFCNSLYFRLIRNK